jgi:hypothetical protein
MEFRDPILCIIFKYNVFSIWEGATRLTRNDDTKIDAVGVIAFYRRLLHYDCIVLVKQYRPALKAYTIEMPAGELKYCCIEAYLSMLCVFWVT